MHHWDDSQIFRLAIENASDHIIITDPDAYILYANKAVELVTGYSQQEIIGKRPNLWGGLMPLEFYKKLWKRLKTDKKPFVGEIKNRRKNGEIYDAEIKVAPVLDGRGTLRFFVGIERDISKLKQIDKAKSEIISLTAHQLKNAPSTIKVFSDSLLDGIAGKLTKKQERYVNEIRLANKNNIDLISSLLNVTRLELGTFSGNPQWLDIKRVSEKVIRSLNHLIKHKKLNCVRMYDPSLKNVLLNAEGYEILLHNLLSNALKYSPDNGKVELRIKHKKTPSFILVDVADEGCGIPISEQSRVFTKLFRADNVKVSVPDGSGLGLYMVRLIVKKLKGKITFESVENKGTKFHVEFPADIQK